MNIGPKSVSRIFLNVLDSVLSVLEDDFTLPSDAAIFVEGSVAEGFGTTGSDIDVSVITASESDFPSPAVVVVNSEGYSWRVEVTFRRHSDIDNAIEVLSSNSRAPSLHVLRRCHRTAYSYVLRKTARLQAQLNSIDLERLAAAIEVHYLYIAHQAHWQAMVARTLGNNELLTAELRSLVRNSAIVWCARNGETYPGHKWLPAMLSRGKLEVKTIEQFMDCADPRVQVDSDELFEKSLTLSSKLLDLEFSNVDKGFQIEKISCREWSISERLFLISETGKIFELCGEVKKAWDHLPLPSGELNDLLCDAIRELFANGLIEIAAKGNRLWKSHTRIFGVRSTLSHIGARGPILAGNSNDQIRLVPISAQDLASAGISLIHHAIRVESWLEDAVGAFNDENWDMLTIFLWNMMEETSSVMLYSLGAQVIDRQSATEFLRNLADLPSEVESPLCSIEYSKVRSIDDAARLSASVQQYAKVVFEFVEAQPFHGIYGDSQLYIQALVAMQEWKELGDFVGRSFSIDNLPEQPYKLVLEENFGTKKSVSRPTFGVKPAAVASFLNYKKDLRIVAPS